MAGPPLLTETDEEAAPSTARVNEPALMAVPVSGMVRGEDGSELAMLRVPERVPRAVGVKVTCAVQVAPASRVAGHGRDTEKSPEAARTSEEMGAVPALVRVRERLAEAPRTSEPKARLLGETVRRDWMPVPLSGTVRALVEAEVAIESVPGRTPVAEGVKVTWTVQLWPAGSVPPGAGQEPAGV